MLRSRKACSAGLIASAVLFFSATWSQASEVYDNGPVRGTNAYTVNNGYVVSDSFVSSTATNLTEAQVGLWTGSGTPSSLDWSIGTTPFGSQVSSSLSPTSVSSTYLGTNSAEYYMFESVFAVNGSIAAGERYWLTISNAQTSPFESGVYWDATFGPSAAGQEYPNDPDEYGIYSESFQLYGNASPTPEPGTLMLLGMGLVGLSGVGLRKVRRVG